MRAASWQEKGQIWNGQPTAVSRPENAMTFCTASSLRWSVDVLPYSATVGPSCSSQSQTAAPRPAVRCRWSLGVGQGTQESEHPTTVSC